MPVSRGPIAAGAIAALVLLGACTAEQSGTPMTSPTSTSEQGGTTTTSPPETSESSTGNSEGAPKVDEPLDVSAVVDKPCTTLTAAQVSTLGVEAGEQREGPLGQVCKWRTSLGGSISVAFTVKNPGGLAAVYKANELGRFAYFEPLPDIAGYPAVANGIFDGRDKGQCGLSVGVRDELVLAIDLVQSQNRIGTAEPCSVAVDATNKVLATIKAG